MSLKLTRCLFSSGTNPQYTNPFKVAQLTSELINFATGVVATKRIQESVVATLDKGYEVANKPFNERLVSTEEEE